MDYEKIIRTIKNNERFLISTHVNPDPDALCSELALAMYLRSLGKKVAVINSEEVPRRFRFLPGTQWIKMPAPAQAAYDVAVIVDCGDLNRIGNVQDVLRDEKILVNIDHHATNDRFGDLNLVDQKASSTAEILYELLRAAKCRFTKNLAMHLYVGIMTDTGSFRYENTRPRTHFIAGDLMRFRFSAAELYRKLYESIPHADVKTFTKVISRFDLLLDGQVVFLELSKKILSQFSDEFDIRDALFKFFRAMKGVEVLGIFTEVSLKKTRINFRSSRKVDVAQLAHRFAGGGHRRASGCTIERSMKEARRLVLDELKKLL